MCGVAGFLASPRFDLRRGDETLRRMARTLVHRGPDAEGFWFDAQACVGLAHRRLAIVDLSEAGHQPMASASGRYVLSYNGEIYNAAELRNDLDHRASYVWRGHSDTEVLLTLIETLGLRDALERLDGMYAFALFDRQTRQLHLARDPFGEKPLYYGQVDGSLVFASELPAFRQFAGFDSRLDETAVQAYLRYGYIPAPRSIYASVRKLEAGCVISFTGSAEIALATRQRFWDAETEATRAASEGGDASEEALEHILRTSVRRRLASDVPVGCLLSGGIDSSLTAALMQSEHGRPIQTFHLSTGAAGYDESAHARTVAEIIGSEHHELRADARLSLSVARRMSTAYGEPFADSSQIAAYLIAELTAEHVRVALSGDGGDEIFGGYNRHIQNLWPMLNRVPVALRATAAASAEAIGAKRWDKWTQQAPLLFSRELQAGRAGSKVQKLAGLMRARDESDYHQRLISLNVAPENLIVGRHHQHMLPNASTAGFSLPERLMLHDTLYYLPDDILVKTDRASMAHSLELRTPFLSRDVFRHAWARPFADKVSGGRGKLPLRKLLSRFIPDEVIERPKQGFAIPIGSWLKGDLHEWANELMSERCLAEHGVLDPKTVTQLWSRHQSGGADLSAQVWSLVVLQSWLSEADGQQRREASMSLGAA